MGEYLEIYLGVGMFVGIVLALVFVILGARTQLVSTGNVTIDINDDGTVTIASINREDGDLAKKRIEDLTAEVEVGATYEGKVVKIMDFGAFVNLLPGQDGMVHISEICHERVAKVTDKITEGETVKVKVLEVDKQGRVRLSMKALEEKPE